ncbi:MAG: hypothetical protein DCC68_18145 [Planctomycetota bacterium]|nr:MAG: hypothetical protein DCC68_18145 [Planctomycetota bacterium]
MQGTTSHKRRSLRYAALVAGVAAVIATWCAANASEGETEAADEAAKSGPTRIVEPIAPKAFDADGDPDLAAVVEIWKKLRGEQAGNGPDAEALADVLRQVKEQDDSHPTTRSEAGDEKPPQRYAEAYAVISELSNKPNPTAQDDAWLLRLALLGYGWQKRYDAELADRAAALRKAARALDEVAANLEEADLYSDADELFEHARSFRDEARQIRQSVANTNVDYSVSEAALAYNLHTLRSQIQLYRNEHGGRFPEVKPDDDGNLTLPQLLATTNAKGEIGTGPEYALGPYMLTMPRNPLAYEKTGHVVAEVDQWPPKKTVPRVGWLYHPPTGRIVPNNAGRLVDQNDEF